MSSPLLKQWTLADLRSTEGDFKATLSIAQMPRLGALHLGGSDASFAVTAALEGRSPMGRRQLPGFSAAAVGAIDVVCQRCLETMSLALNVEFETLLAREGDERVEDSDKDVWEMTDERLSLIEVIEEYLLLAMPFAPKHDEDCLAVLRSEPVVVRENENTGTRKPFAGLAALLGDGQREKN